MNPSINQLLQEVREESTIWCSAGASELESLWVGSVWWLIVRFVLVRFNLSGVFLD